MTPLLCHIYSILLSYFLICDEFEKRHETCPPVPFLYIITLEGSMAKKLSPTVFEEVVGVSKVNYSDLLVCVCLCRYLNVQIEKFVSCMYKKLARHFLLRKSSVGWCGFRGGIKLGEVFGR